MEGNTGHKVFDTQFGKFMEGNTGHKVFDTHFGKFMEINTRHKVLTHSLVSLWRATRTKSI